MFSKIQFMEVLGALAKTGAHFLNESELQHQIGSTIEHMFPDSTVHYEYPTEISGDNVSIDIVIETDGLLVPVEIKYPLEQSHTPVANYIYHFYRDVSRLEYLTGHKPNMHYGYCLFLSNDPRFWSCGRKISPDANAREMLLHEGLVLYGTKIWHNKGSNPNLPKNYPPIQLKEKYNITWHNYGNMAVPKQKKSLFKYVLLECGSN